MGPGPRAAPSTRHPMWWCRQSKVSSIRLCGPGDRALMAPACRSTGAGLLPFIGECGGWERRLSNRSRASPACMNSQSAPPWARSSACFCAGLDDGSLPRMRGRRADRLSVVMADRGVRVVALVGVHEAAQQLRGGLLEDDEDNRADEQTDERVRERKPAATPRAPATCRDDHATRRAGPAPPTCRASTGRRAGRHRRASRRSGHWTSWFPHVSGGARQSRRGYGSGGPARTWSADRTVLDVRQAAGIAHSVEVRDRRAQEVGRDPEPSVPEVSGARSWTPDGSKQDDGNDQGRCPGACGPADAPIGGACGLRTGSDRQGPRGVRR